MLPRCILDNPVNGGRLRWKEILQIVRDRIRRWQAGDIPGLWSDFLANEEKRSRRRGGPGNLSHPDALQASNVRRAKRSIEAGQYRKGI